MNENCQICKTGRIKPGYTHVSLHRGDSIVIIKQVPADICDNCGEYYLDEIASALVLEIAQDAVSRGAEVEIKRYPAA